MTRSYRKGVLRTMRRDLGFIIVIAGVVASSQISATAENWPGWRGPRGDGTCLEQNVPTNWDPAGALWKTELPGQGHASPIVSVNLRKTHYTTIQRQGNIRPSTGFRSKSLQASPQRS